MTFLSVCHLNNQVYCHSNACTKQSVQCSKTSLLLQRAPAASLPYFIKRLQGTGCARLKDEREVRERSINKCVPASCTVEQLDPCPLSPAELLASAPSAPALPFVAHVKKACGNLNSYLQTTVQEFKALVAVMAVKRSPWIGVFPKNRNYRGLVVSQ